MATATGSGLCGRLAWQGSATFPRAVDRLSRSAHKDLDRRSYRDWNVIASSAPESADRASVFPGSRWLSLAPSRLLHLDSSREIGILVRERDKRAWILSANPRMRPRDFFDCVRRLREAGYVAERLHCRPGMQIAD